MMSLFIYVDGVSVESYLLVWGIMIALFLLTLIVARIGRAYDSYKEKKYRAIQDAKPKTVIRPGIAAGWPSK